jgi:hypothetical protein
MGSGGGSCRRGEGTAAVIGQREVIGAGKLKGKRRVQMPGRELEKLEKAPGVQKKWCSCSSRCWRLGGARGSRGGARAGAM